MQYYVLYCTFYEDSVTVHLIKVIGDNSYSVVAITIALFYNTKNRIRCGLHVIINQCMDKIVCSYLLNVCVDQEVLFCR